jgi:hypothetical protein
MLWYLIQAFFENSAVISLNDEFCRLGLFLIVRFYRGIKGIGLSKICQTLIQAELVAFGARSKWIIKVHSYCPRVRFYLQTRVMEYPLWYDL